MNSLRLGLAALTALTLAGCGRDLPFLGATEGSSGLRLVPGDTELFRGQAFRFDVVLDGPSSSESVLGREGLELAVIPEGLATVTPTGDGNSLQSGTGQLVARFSGEEARANIIVRDAELVGLVVTPAEVGLERGRRGQLQVVGSLSDGSNIDLAPGAAGTVYRNSAEEVVTVGENGGLLALQAGEAVITVQNGTFTGNATVRVVENGPTLTGIAIEPDPIIINPGLESTFAVIGTRSDGSTIDLTNDPGLTVRPGSDVAFLTGPGRIATGASRGETTLEASFQTFSATAQVSIRDTAGFVGLRVEPEDIVLEPREQAQLRVIAVRSDGVEQDVTSDPGVTYPVSRIFSIDGNGLLSAFAPTASQTLAVSFQGLIARFRLTIREPGRELVAITIQPRVLELNVGESRQVTVLGRFSDGTTEDVTMAATFATSDLLVAVVGPGGLVRVTSEGSTTLTASVGPITDRIVVRGVAIVRRLIGLEISPSALRLQEGQTLPIQVLARFSDGTSQDVTTTPGTTITTQDPTIARFNGMMVQGIGAGRTQLTATRLGFNATAEIAVETGPPAMPVGIDLVIANSVGLMESTQAQVFLRFADGSRIDISVVPGLNLTSSNTGAVSVMGLTAIGVGAGQSVITVSFLGFTDQATVIVRPPAERLISLAWLPTTLTLNTGQTQIARLIGTFNTGRSEDLTVNPGVVLGVNGNITAVRGGSTVNVTGTAGGVGSITATFQGQQATLQVTVRNSNPTLVEVRVEAPSRLEVGASGPLAIVARFSDGTTRDISTDPGLSLALNTPGVVQLGVGTLRAVGQGVVTLTATFQGRTGRATVTVVPAMDPIVRIEFQPSTLDVQVNQSVTIRVFAVRQSGQRDDITLDPGITGNVTGNITTGLGPNNTVQVTGTAAGTGRIVVQFQGFSATLNVTVRSTNQQVVGLSITLTTSQIEVGRSENFSVTARFADGTTRDVTTDPGLSISVLNSAVLQLTGTSQVRGVSVGITQLQASFGGRSTLRTVRVIAQTQITGIFFSPGQLVLRINQSRFTRLFATRAGASNLNVTTSTETTYTSSGPISFTVNPNGTLNVTGNGNGTGTITATFRGFQATLNVPVGTAPRVIGLDLTPANPTTLAVNGTVQITATARFSDGSTQNVTSSASFQDASSPGQTSAISVSSTGLVRGLNIGQGRVIVRALGFTRLLIVNINATPPRITSLSPNRLSVSAPTRTLTLTGTGFVNGDRIFVNGSPVPTTFTSATQLRFTNAGPLFRSAGTLSVQVRGASGVSNTVTLTLGAAPQITSISPNQILANMSVQVRLMGTGLTGLSISGAPLTYSGVTSGAGGTSASVRVSAAANTMAGNVTVTVSNGFGSDTFVMTVTQPTAGLTLATGSLQNLSGTNAFTSVNVRTFAGFSTSGNDPVVILSSGDVTFAANSGILLSGNNGVASGGNGGDGGDAGAGGSGGGGGGDGDDATPATGGAGSPAGSAAATSAGSGTAGGSGGGAGGGAPGSSGCAQGGGGGALGGNGGNGGGDAGNGRGGAGGTANGGSDFSGGTGGGGGSTCGNRGGAGGGGGGGVLIIQVANGRSITIGGEILAAGGEGGGATGSAVGAGGGGSGGRVELRAPGGNIVLTGNIRVNGGAGGRVIGNGDAGGGGSGGVIVLEASNITAISSRLRVNGGPAGTSSGGNNGTTGSNGQVERLP